MAYSTGTAASLNALYDALMTFATSNGWTNTDSPSTRDKVIRSVGSDSKKSMYIRLTASTEANNPFKADTSLHKKFPHILARGYQFWNAGAGQNEFGHVGPFIAAGQQTSSTQRFYLHPFEATPVPLNYPAIQAKALSANIAGAYSWGQWSEERVMFTGLTAYDVVTGEVVTSPAGPTNPHFNKACVVYNPTTNTTHVYGLATIATLVDQFWRWNPETGELIKMPAPIWTAASPQGGGLVWDGNDTIYAVRAGTSTDFAKFVISTQTWTNLAATTVSRPSNFSSPSSGTPWNMTYLPAAITGLSEDIITMPLGASGTTLYKYNVTSNTWGTITASPFTLNGQVHMFFDHRKYLYLGNPNGAVTNWYRAPVDAPGVGTWVSLGTLEESIRAFEGADLIHSLASKLRASEAFLMTYWFVGDVDSITAVTKIDGKYYWMHFGHCISSYRSEVMKTTGSVSAGQQVTVPVDSSANYSAGDIVLIWDPSSALVEKKTIQSVPNGTSIVLSLNNAYPTGSFVGVDPDHQVLTGDSGWAVCLLDGKGYRSDPMSATYYLTPQSESREELARFNRSGRGLVMPVPAKLASYYSNLPGTYETRGVLRGVYFLLINTTFASPYAEDILKINGSQYLVIDPAYSKRLTNNNHLIAIGPIA